MSGLSSLIFAQLIKNYEQEIRGVLIRRCGCAETAADILQETYQRLLSSGLWQQAENPRALLHRIAANLATDYERRQATQSKYITQVEALPEASDPGLNTTPEQILLTHERLECLARAVETLSPKCRTVFILRKVDELSHAEIAERLNISRNMVEKHLRHALQVLQQVDRG
jgi:RNA polymerase sigma-70 factor (ECF subfamily)